MADGMETSDPGQVGLGSFAGTFIKHGLIKPFEALVTFAKKLQKVNDMRDGMSKGAKETIDPNTVMLDMLNTTLTLTFADLNRADLNVQVEHAAETLTDLLTGTSYVLFLEYLLTVLRCTVSIRAAQYNIEMMAGINPTE